MKYNPLSTIDSIERSKLLANKIIVKALQSNRGDIVRAMNAADLKKMIQSVTLAVFNKLGAEAHAYKCYKYLIERDRNVVGRGEKFKPITDVEIEKEVTAYFEIDGKLQYREVKIGGHW